MPRNRQPKLQHDHQVNLMFPGKPGEAHHEVAGRLLWMQSATSWSRSAVPVHNTVSAAPQYRRRVLASSSTTAPQVNTTLGT